MKTIWKGALSFGLVNIPLQLFTAHKPQATAFNLLCGTCNNLIKYERWCTHCKKEISWENVVKGLKIGDDKYFVITKEQLEELKPKTTEIFSIVEFINPTLISPLFYQNHYYGITSKTGQKAFTLFKKALEETKMVALGTFVMHEKEHLAIIQPYEDIFLLITLYYSYEIYKTTVLPLQKKIEKIDTNELKLAKQLINQLAVKKFDISKFKDDFAENIARLVKKSKGKKVRLPKLKEIKITKDKTLMDSLRASLKEHVKPLKPVYHAKKR